MHATNKDKAIVEKADRITPNERWQSQQKTAWAKLRKSATPDQQAEDFAEQMITEHSPVQKVAHDLGAKLEATPADAGTPEAG